MPETVYACANSQNKEVMFGRQEQLYIYSWCAHLPWWSGSSIGRHQLRHAMRSCNRAASVVRPWHFDFKDSIFRCPRFSERGCRRPRRFSLSLGPSAASDEWLLTFRKRQDRPHALRVHAAYQVQLTNTLTLDTAFSARFAISQIDNFAKDKSSNERQGNYAMWKEECKKSERWVSCDGK